MKKVIMHFELHFAYILAQVTQHYCSLHHRFFIANFASSVLSPNPVRAARLLGPTTIVKEGTFVPPILNKNLRAKSLSVT